MFVLEFEFMYSARIRHGTLLVFTCIVTLSLSNASNAVPLSIFNTGTDGTNASWGSANVSDIHYTVIAPSVFTPVTVDDTQYPFPAFWLANNYGSPGSQWIGPAGPNAVGPVAPFIYRTTFNLPANANLSTVNITGGWASDDGGTDIKINGTSTGQISPFNNSLTPFSVNSGFVFGTNTLDFLLTNNGGGPTGLRVDHIAGSFQVVPEPATVAFACFGLMIGGCLCRRGRRC
jgi:hypothetical protein